MANSGQIEVFEAIPPNFFKIVLDPNEHLLRIPDDFAERYGYLLPDFATIKTLDGISWKIKVVRDDDGEIWLKGLDTFYDFYSIDLGHLFVFKYYCESVFNVHIYDTSATEIDYGINGSGEELNQVEVIEDGFTINDHPATKSVTKSVEKKKNSQASNGLRTRKTRKPVKRFGIDYETSKAYQKAKDSKAASSPQNYFISLIRRSYVRYMLVPKDFAKNHLKDKKKEIELCVSGKTWGVQVNHMRDTRIRGGWMVFLKENNVEVGDVCAFEVRKGNQFIWDVEIHRK